MNQWYEVTSDGILLRLQVQPKASRTQVVGLHGAPPRLKIRLAAPPVEGAANEELLSFLKKQLKVTFSQLELVRGHSSKMKDVLCRGVALEKVLSLNAQNAG